MRIGEVVARRSDLSTFLVHLTRTVGDAPTAKDNLASIIRADAINAYSPYGQAVKKLVNANRDVASQRCVCFTETPLEHVNLLTETIEDRNYHFEPYGIAITRKQGRSRGVNPVWYLDITPGHDWLTTPINELIEAGIQAGDFDQQHIARLAPYIEQMGTGERVADGYPYKKEFWWEREWRHRGNFSLPNNYLVLCPTADIPEMAAAVNSHLEEFRPTVRYIDPSWSLEMIIGRLAGIPAAELGPF